MKPLRFSWLHSCKIYIFFFHIFYLNYEYRPISGERDTQIPCWQNTLADQIPCYTTRYVHHQALKHFDFSFSTSLILLIFSPLCILQLKILKSFSFFVLIFICNSAQSAWQSFVAYDACFRLCLNAWERNCMEAPEFLRDECMVLRNAFGYVR